MKHIITLALLVFMTITVNADKLNDAISNRQQFTVLDISREVAHTYKDKLNQYNKFITNKWYYQYSPTSTTFWAGYDMTIYQYNETRRFAKWWVRSNRVKGKREMVVKIRQYLSNNIVYDYEYKQASYTQYGALKGKAVCQGMTLLMKDMLDEAGIGNRVLRSENHSWNEVLINGKRYEIDITKDIGLGIAERMLRYQIFILGG